MTLRPYQQDAPVCPKCGKRSLTNVTSYGLRHKCCGLWSWDGAPLVNAATHEARKAAHAAFDALWKHHGMTRSNAYRELARKLGVSKEKCHMKLMDESTALKVPRAVISIIADLDDGQVIE